jgi:hypothetical protein
VATTGASGGPRNPAVAGCTISVTTGWQASPAKHTKTSRSTLLVIGPVMGVVGDTQETERFPGFGLRPDPCSGIVER